MTRPFVSLLLLLALAAPSLGAPDRPRPAGPAPVAVRPNARVEAAPDEPARPEDPTPAPAGSPWEPTTEDFKGLRSVALIGLVSLAPAGLLMFTSFLRINIVLVLLRQALGSPQVPGNQVLAALALLLTLLVMKPVGESVYARAVEPYAARQISASQAWERGSGPIKGFMIDQIRRTNHGHYLRDLYDFAEPPRPGRFEPTYGDEFPLRVVAPAFLLSELTTALMIGFLIYLPFLVVDLVVSAVLSAMGLFMLPPSLVALPLKLVLFVLADGWLLVATALLRTFAVPGDESMEMSDVIDGSREAIRMALLLGGPLLAVALVVGLVVGVGQTLTQMHEPAVGQVARLVAVLGAVLLALPWLLGRWVAYAVELIGSIPDRI